MPKSASSQYYRCTSLQYRPEIDGLRAIAVVPVLLFHAGFAPFSGGYVGVDVFFVISGYLIAAILLREIAERRFSLWRFYERRARRILPALFVVMLASVPPALAWMMPDDLENFGQSLVANLLFANNILIYLTSGYWDLAAEFKPMLHTWSLAVEEQYYVLFPPLLWLAWRGGTHTVIVMVTGLALVSLALAHWAAAHAPEAGFFLLPTRMWELLMGVFAALYFHDRAPSHRPLGRRTGSVIAAAGLLAILTSCVAYDESLPFPGLYALLPCGGALAIILFASPENAAGRLLASRPAVAIGLISYSLYLWHQPLFAFARIRSLEPPGPWEYVALIIAAFALATLTWRFVEQPFRQRRAVRLMPMMTGFGIVALLVGAVGITLHRTSGFYNEWSTLASPFSATFDGNQNIGFNMRVFGDFGRREFADPDRPNVLVVGDSFARDFINMGAVNGYFRTVEISYTDNVPTCVADIDLSELESRLTDVDILVFGSPNFSRQCWEDDVAVLSELVPDVIVIGTKDFGYNLQAVFRMPEAERYGATVRIRPEVVAANAELRRLVGDRYVDLIELTSVDGFRTAVFTSDRKLMSVDRIHLTYHGAREFGRLVFQHPLLQRLR